MIRAVIFDMDGVISDTQKLHAEVESNVLARYGISVSPDEITRKYAGVSYRQMLGEIFDGFGVTADIDAVAQETRETLQSYLGHRRITPITGAPELINALYGEGMKLAVASSSRLRFIDQVLTELGLKDKFHAVASGEEVVYGKPAPDIFLLAASRLGSAANECVVIEDGVSGMIGAKSAGMKCIGLVEGGSTNNLQVDLLVDSLQKVNPDIVRGL